MFSKKKSLARIAQLRGKKKVSPTPTPDAEKEAAAEIAQAATAEQDNNSSDESRSSSKRPSLSNSQNELQLPLSRQASISSPDLTGLPPKPPPKQPPLRNRLFKFSSGSLHSQPPPSDFDHDFDDSNMIKSLLSKQLNPSEDPPNSSFVRNMLHSPRRTQSVRVTPIVRLQDEDGVERGAPPPRVRVSSSTSPVRIMPRSRSARHFTRKKSGSPPSDRRPSSSSSSQVPNPNHVSPAPSAPASLDNSSDDDDDDSFNEEDDNNGPSVYCTPPKNGGIGCGDNVLSPFRNRKESVTKSRSMTHLATTSPLDPIAQSLTAAVCATQARTRSYLLGAVGATSLLGPQALEKCFPDRTLRLFVGTWNMNGKAPPRHLADFLLPQNLEFVPDILVVGTQESFPERTEWEVRLQDTLGPSHVLFHSSAMGTLHLAVFLRRDLIWCCSVPETDSFNVHPAMQFRTKGAIAVAFLLFGTSFLFVNSHLSAHEENIVDRIKDYRKITAMLNLPRELPSRASKHKEISEKFDCVFWCGDLNFRLEQSREVVIGELEEGSTSVLDFDQLNYLRAEGLIFKGFHESDIAFAPTFKYDVGSNRFDTSAKQRTPSYTDRILYKSQRSTAVRPVHYDSVQDVLTSDHRPVWGIWEVKIRPGRDTIPLAGGLFNRDVYIDGLRRRVEALQPVLVGKNGASKCSIQ